jgi:cytoskeletal protein CcmA (bactofilin family)
MNGFSTRGRRLLAIAGVALLATLLAVPTARAFEGRGGDVIVIEADEVIDDDLYVGASEFTLDGTVKGDLFVVGSTIEINGTVEGDLVAAGQSVVVDGTVEDDARIACYTLVVGGDVADDLVAAGFSLDNRGGSKVGGDLLSVGYQALLAGDVTGSAEIAGGAVRLAGTIGGDANVDVGGAEPGQQMPPGFPFFYAPNVPPVPSVPTGLTIDEGARIGGDLSYTANARIAIPGGAVAGDVDFTRYVPEVEARPEVKAPSPAALVGGWFVRQLRRLITLLLVGAFMMWLVPGWTRKVANVVQTRPLPSLGWGVVAIAAFVFAMLVLIVGTVLLAVFFGVVTLGELAGRFAVLGGIVMSTAGFGFSVVWSYVTKIVISLLLGQLIFTLFKSPAAENRWWPVLLGVVIFVAITAIPVLGWLARLATVLLGLGAAWLWARDWLAARRPAPVAVEAETEDVAPA